MGHHASGSRSLSVLATLLFFAVAGPAGAQSEQDRRDCFSLGSNDFEKPEFYDIGLAACNKFIRSGNLSGKDLQPYVKQRADWLRRKKEYDAALRDFSWAIELDPNDVENYDFRGDIYVDRGEYDRAINDYNTAIRMRPGYAPAYYARGLALEKAGRLEEAVASYRQATKLPLPATENQNTIRLYRWGIDSSRQRLEKLGR